ncbi:hypothetical protein L0F63_001213, partial [Massospora cicadina]
SAANFKGPTDGRECVGFNLDNGTSVVEVRDSKCVNDNPLPPSEKKIFPILKKDAVMWNFKRNFDGLVFINFMLVPGNASFTKESEAYRITIVEYFYTLVLPMRKDLIRNYKGAIHISSGSRGPVFTVHANKCNIFTILKDLFELLRKDLTQSALDQAKNETLYEGRDSIDKVYYQLSLDGLSPLINHIDVVRSIHLKSFNEFREKLLERSYTEVLVLSDLNDGELKKLLELIKPTSKLQPTIASYPMELIKPTSKLQPTIAPYPKPIKLTNGTYYQKMKAWDSDIKSTGLLFYLETYKYTDKRSLFLSHIIQHLLSTEIKPTLENLGIVYIGVQPVVFQGGIMILIDGNRNPTDLEKEVEKFLDTVKTKIEQLPDEEFKAKLDALKLKLKPAEPYQILENYWKSIENRFFDFEWGKRSNFNSFSIKTDLIKFIDSVNRTQVLDFYNAKIKKSSQRIKFSAHLTPKNLNGPNTNMTKETEFGELITDRFEWRERQNSWNYPEGFYPRAYDGPFKSEGP